MSIESKLFFEFRKEFADLDATHVKEYYSGKDYANDIVQFRNAIASENIMKDGKVDYTQFKKGGKIINNFKGFDIEDMKQETAEQHIYKQYKDELIDFVYNKLANPV